MTARVTGLWRHPVKSHGREPLDNLRLTAGQTMPWDRTWAVVHDAARISGAEWSPCANFNNGAKAPGLMAIDARLDEATETLTLTHPDLPDLTFRPDADPQALIAWSRPLIPEARAQSARIIRVPGRGMTDTDFPSVSIGNMASHRVVAAKLGRSLSEKRWRTNIWFDGMPPWEEGDWIGRSIRIGRAEIAVREPVLRCLATTANPDTGKRDADTLGVLNAERAFCVYGEVIASGDIARDDSIEVLPIWN